MTGMVRVANFRFIFKSLLPDKPRVYQDISSPKPALYFTCGLIIKHIEISKYGIR